MVRPILDFSMPGDRSNRGGGGTRIKSIFQLKKILDSKSYPPEVTKKLIKLASSYPGGSLDFFYDNLSIHVGKIMSELPKEENSELTPDVTVSEPAKKEKKPSLLITEETSTIKRKSFEEDLEVKKAPIQKSSEKVVYIPKEDDAEGWGDFIKKRIMEIEEKNLQSVDERIFFD